MANTDLKEFAKEKGVYLWQIAETLKMVDSNFSRKLRHELPEVEKLKIRQIISELSIKEA